MVVVGKLLDFHIKLAFYFADMSKQLLQDDYLHIFFKFESLHCPTTHQMTKQNPALRGVTEDNALGMCVKKTDGELHIDIQYC